MRAPNTAVRRWVSAAVVATTIAACAAPPSTAPGPDDALAAGPEIPTLPDKMPTGPDGIILPAPSAAPGPDIPEAVPSAPSEGDVAGYTGTMWAAHLDNEVSVLAESLTVRNDTVFGLVSNGRSTPVGPVTVSAAGVTAEIPIPILRPGEPAPFALQLEAVENVSGLEFVVDAPDATTTPPRGLRLSTFWQRGVGDTETVNTYLFTDSGTGAQPAVAFGSAMAIEAIEGLVVVAAWIDPAGRVLAVDPAAEVQLDTLATGETSDFLVRSPGPEALDGATVVLWASGS